MSQKYSVNPHFIETILSWVKSGEVAIPEIQRPFVWDSSKVRDLLDSLYNGFPIGYIIIWKNPNIKLKDGSISEGKKILIDGQQRLTAMQAAMLGKQVINHEYKKVHIRIAFHPIEERFEVLNPAIEKSKVWIHDVSKVLAGNVSILKLVREYRETNPNIDEELLEQKLNKLISVPKRQIGVIELNSELDIETVTEIFIRINSQGVVLSQADFAMSKIAANEKYGGQDLRKAIDYFCHIAVAPHFYEHIENNDTQFAKTDYFNLMKWMKDESDDLYEPSYTDLLRVAFSTEFHRGKLGDLVSLLSGRNFETRTFEESIAEGSFEKLKKGVKRFMNQTEFKRFLMIIRSAGFIVSKMVRSQNALNFAFSLYLTLREQGYEQSTIEKYVKKWFVLTVLTGRSSGSFESVLDYDIKQFGSRAVYEYINQVEESELGDGFWNVGLVEHLSKASGNSPHFYVFLAAQVFNNDKGFLSRDITIADLLRHRGDIHHLFPKKYLKKQGHSWGKYNQIANYVLMQQEINIKIGDKSPADYFNLILKQVENGGDSYGLMESKEALNINLDQHAIPKTIFNMREPQYDEFLKERRNLMAQKIKDYYYSL